MKKFMFIVGFLAIFSSFGFCANNLEIVYYVDGFYTNSESVKSNIIQDNTDYNLGCGPTSLLFIKNHDSQQNQGICPIFVGSVSAAQNELSNMYDFINPTDNSITEFYHLKDIAKNYWGWDNVRRMSANSTVDYNVGELIGCLDDDELALVVLDSSYSGNPVSGYNTDHIVVVYAYQKRQDDSGNTVNSSSNDRQNDRIYFYDPYYGGNGYFERGEIDTAVNLTNFAFLKVAP